MAALFVSLELAALGAVLMVWLRLRAVAAQVMELCPADSVVGTALESLPEVLADHARDDLLPESDHRGLESIRVRPTEVQDAYKTAAELLTRLSAEAAGPKPVEREERAKKLYQLQHSLDLPDPAVGSFLSRIADEWKASGYAGALVEKVEFVRKGTHLDHKSMWPLNSGTRVRFPLGFVIRGPEERVLSKAKVVCE